MVIRCIIQFMKCIEAQGEVRTKSRRIVVSDRTAIWLILMLVVVRETCDFLDSQSVSPSVCSL